MHNSSAQDGATASISSIPDNNFHSDHKKTNLFPMALGSIGVVFGDIGTSPLYALKTALAHAKDTGGASPAEVIGIVSLLVWALVFTVTLKYVAFLMRADNKGEGGTLALMALAQRAMGERSKWVFLLGVAGAALFSGDAIITPAISVLSAVEGLNYVSPVFEHYVIYIAVAILLVLFMSQSSGTERIGKFFGPVMVVFFFVIAALGLWHIFDAPQILWAVNPLTGLEFLFGNGLAGFVILGLVFLGVTGAEALYADMGHFGRLPIQLAWIFFVLPALVLNYFGQGALILSHPEAISDPFYLMAPLWAVPYLVILSTAATVIASQAVITGAFSIVRSGIQLGLLPRMEIRHTSESQEGQIFIPRVNRLLLIGVLVLTLLFKSSDALANAYGISVVSTMVVTTALAFVVVWKLWKWPLWGAIAVVAVFIVIDLAFFVANLIKVLEGGWVPLSLAALGMIVMWTWVRGTKLLESKMHRDSLPMTDLVRMLDKRPPTRVAGTAIFLSSDPKVAPSALMHNLKHNKVLHERIVIMSVRTEDMPKVSPSQRYEVRELAPGFLEVILHFGFMESPRIPAALALMRKSGFKFDIMTTSFFLGRRTLKMSKTSGMPMWQDKLYIGLTRQAISATDFFSIPSDRVVELGAQVSI